jgi:hypothetical protein
LWLNVAKRDLIFDDRQTLHSVRLVDVANRVGRTLESSLSLYRTLISRDGGATSNHAFVAVKTLSVERDTPEPAALLHLIFLSLSPFSKECILDRAVSAPIVVKDLGLYSAP